MDKNPMTLYCGRYTNGEEHEKMLSVISLQRNAN